MERKAKVTLATGDPPAPVGTPCTFQLLPNKSSHNCRSVVKCGPNIVYGDVNQGYLDCAFVDGLPTTAQDISDTDGDPAFDMDLGARKLLVKASSPGKGYGLTIQLEP